MCLRQCVCVCVCLSVYLLWLHKVRLLRLALSCTAIKQLQFQVAKRFRPLITVSRCLTSDSYVRNIIMHIFRSLNYVHYNNVFYGDFLLENIYLAKNSFQTSISFGLEFVLSKQPAGINRLLRYQLVQNQLSAVLPHRRLFFVALYGLGFVSRVKAV